jgi:hypothetical protein
MSTGILVGYVELDKDGKDKSGLVGVACVMGDQYPSAGKWTQKAQWGWAAKIAEAMNKEDGS